MVEMIKQAKDQVLEKMEQSISERGVERMDVAEIDKLADIVKDLAEAEKSCWEAEYYRSVTEQMGSSGYDSMGYSGQGSRGGQGGGNRSGYRDSMGRYARRGYTMGYHEPMEGIREAMMSASPEEREKMRRELRQMADMA